MACVWSAAPQEKKNIYIYTGVPKKCVNILRDIIHANVYRFFGTLSLSLSLSVCVYVYVCVCVCVCVYIYIYIYQPRGLVVRISDY